MNEPMEKFVKWMEEQEHIPGSSWARAIEKARAIMSEELKEKMGGMICPRCSAVVILPDGYKKDPR